MSRKKRKKGRAQRRLAQTMAKRSSYAAKKIAQGINPRSGKEVEQ